MGAGSPAPGPAQSLPVQPSSDPEHESKLKKWRDKAKAAYARKKAAAKSGNPFSSPVSPSAGVDSQPLPQTVAPAALPWNPNDLQGFIDSILPEVEKLDIRSIVKAAEKISPALAAQVEKDAGWNPVAKTTLSKSGAQVAAKYLGKAGVPAENAPEVFLLGAIASIVISRQNLLSKLEDMAKKNDGLSQAIRETGGVRP